MSELLAKTAARYVKPTYTEVKVGDTVRVYTRIKEGEKERTQYFEGLVIRRKGGIGPDASFTVRRIASGVGVERTFPLHSPLTVKVEIQRGAKVRRATLYTMRGLTGKAARLTEQPVDRKAREVKSPLPARYKVEPALSPEAKAAPKDAEGKPEQADAPANAEQAAAEETPSRKAKAPSAEGKADKVGQGEKTEAAEPAATGAAAKEGKVKDAESKAAPSGKEEPKAEAKKPVDEDSDQTKKS